MARTPGGGDIDHAAAPQTASACAPSLINDGVSMARTDCGTAGEFTKVQIRVVRSALGSGPEKIK
jgi:hypothetical protein